MTETYQRIQLTAITPSPYQPRKTFSDQMLNELAATIQSRGVLSPIRVRPRPHGSPGMFELVFGECRWRASELAGEADIPALVVDLTDDQVIEEILIENLKRTDVPPLEEGEHYHSLLHQHGYTMETLIAKTGKSRTYLYSRMKLAQLAPGAKEALTDGRLTVAVAELIGRIGDAQLQEAACKEVLGLGTWPAYEEAGVKFESIAVEDDHDAGSVRQPLSFRAAAQLLRRRYTLHLSFAKFNPGEAALTSAGACTSCQHRSGNQPELPGVGTITAADLCLRPPCFEAKTNAAWERAATIARDSGLTVIEGEAAEELFDASDHLFASAPYVDPRAELPQNLAKPGLRATWGKLLGKKLSEIPFVVVRDPSGGAVELLDRDAATKMLRDMGKVERVAAPSSPKKQPAAAAPHAAAASSKVAGSGATPNTKGVDKALERQRYAEAALELVLGQVADNAAEDPGRKELAVWRWIAQQVIVTNNSGDADLVGKRHGLRNFDALIGEVEKARTVGAIRALIVEIFMCIDGVSVHTGFAADHDAELRFNDGLRLFGANWDKALIAAKAIANAPEGTCGATDGAGGGACIHPTGHKGLHSNRKRTWGATKGAAKGKQK